jgi:uncharacterized protein (TIGR00661 family)
LRSPDVKIFYGICGEGLGHSGRALALIERLAALGHDVTIYTFGDAFRLLVKGGFQPRRISGLRWCVNSRGGVAPVGTLINLARFVRRRRQSLDRIRQEAIAERPDLIITDFEPLTALAAASLGIHCVSVDNQHRFCQPLGSSFPAALRAYGRFAGGFVRHWIRRPQQCVVAAFHGGPPSREFRRVNALFRESVTRHRATDGPHVLIYSRGEHGRRIAQHAARVDAEFIAYGFEGPAVDNIQYKHADYEQFAADLASSRAVVAAAGHQLISEARYFGKPLLVVPLANQHEQSVNARFVELEHIGEATAIDHLTPNMIQRLLQRPASTPRTSNGVDEVLNLLEIDHG